MSTLEIPQSLETVESAANPYALHPESPQVRRSVGKLLTERTAFIDASNHLDIKDANHEFAVYMLDGKDEFADIGRAVEGSVMSSTWNKSPEDSQEASAHLEQNSLFFVVINVTDPEFPVPVASLSIADMLRGPSETVDKFLEDREENGLERALPSELDVNDEDHLRGIWDVMAIMVPKSARGSNASAWAYHALYKASLAEGVHRWIANMTDNEFDMMGALGIPFHEIAGTNKVPMDKNDSDPVMLGFYGINVDDIHESMRAQIAQLELAVAQGEKGSRLWSKLAKMSRLALAGRLYPVLDSDTSLSA